MQRQNIIMHLIFLLCTKNNIGFIFSQMAQLKNQNGHIEYSDEIQ